MWQKKLHHIVSILIFIPTSLTLRRIHNGKEVQTEKKYAVYFVKAPPSPQKYKGWTCGGALVSPVYIVTAAACVEDVQHLYAIAGYKRFVDTDQLDVDACTKNKKKKVVFTCVPKSYEFRYENVEKWANIDIAVVKVESPYDFTDRSYLEVCSYIPAAIEINYEHKYQEPGTDAMALGWGHTEIWRQTNDETSYNTQYLHYAPTLILDKTTCKVEYTNVNIKDTLVFHTIIDKYMICTRDAGNIDDTGKIRTKSKPLADGCNTRIQKLMGAEGVTCEEDVQVVEYYRREGETNSSKADVEFNEDNGEIIDERNNFRLSSTRRNGICQNDHGGPLVTWVGTSEVLIGVASVFKITNESKCSGPYLFTSTECNGKFLDCILNSPTRRRINCDAPPAERGFEKIERRISWIGHPHGPAENEMIQTRPQVPLHQYRP